MPEILTGQDRTFDFSAEWNRTEAEYPAACIHELFEQQVARTPDRIAAQFENEQLTYAELNARANQLARHLVGSGVRPEHLVAVCVTRSLDMLVALLGVLKAGGAYVPLDPDYPIDRLSFMLEDSQAPVLLADHHTISRLPAWSGVSVLLGKNGTHFGTQSENLSVGVRPANLAYTLFTSGSTGKPKGVQIEHRSVVNFLTSTRLIPGMTAEDIVLAVTTLSFDIAGLDLFLPITTGARVVIVTSETARDPKQLLSVIERCRATVMQATPVTWRMLLEVGWSGSNLKVFCGGEALHRELARQLVANSPSVWNFYGPTETTIYSSVHRVSNADVKTVPIGRPIANTQMYILGSNADPVPVGDVGELYIGGDGLARGYLRRPELTAEKFIPNPFRPGTRLYRTGDLARWLPSGDIEFLGRADQQIKIRGFRIELGEIEAVLEEHSQVRQAAVLAADSADEKQLVAYFTTQPHTGPTAATLRSWLKRKLPDYMIPVAFVRVDAMPLTSNGKVDRRALPQSAPHQSTADKDLAPAGDELETTLVSIWKDVLGRNDVGPRDNFFELGGHSVLAVRVMRRIEQQFKRALPTAALFQAPTIEALCRLVREQGTDEPSRVAVPGSSVALSHLGPRKSTLRRLHNRLLHFLSRFLPGATGLRPALHKLRGVRIHGRVFIGDDVYIENEYPEHVHINDGAMVGLRTTIVAHGHGDLARVIIDKNAFIGVGVTIVAPGDRPLTIGEGSVLMPGAVITGDVPPFTVYGAEPAKPLANLTMPFSERATYGDFISSLRPLGPK